MSIPTVFQKNRYNFHALLAISAMAFGGLAVAAVAVRDDAGARAKTPIPPMASVKQTSNTFAAITKNAAPAVVFIEVKKKSLPQAIEWHGKGAPEMFDEDLLKRFFGDRLPKGFGSPKFQMPQQPKYATGQGSGFIISADGYILTNNHVVGDADNVQVKLADGRQFDAEIVGADQRSDVAVIKIDASDLPVLAMGNSDDIQPGEWVLAVGSPFGLPGTVTSGIVSAKGRSSVGITDYENFIQTDAAINPGNSGGPLLNLKGEVIGINTAIFSRSGGYMGIGFAIPINMARDICDQLIENGSVTRGYLGIVIQPLTADLAKSFALDEAKGVLVGDVTKESPAAEAGLQSGDVIVEFAGEAVDDVGAFRNRVAATPPTNSVPLVVLREGKRVKLDVTVGALPATKSIAKVDADSVESFGLKVQPLDDKLAEKFGYEDKSGVVVTDVQSGSVAALAGLQPGALIKEVNRSPVRTMDEFKAAIKEGQEKGSVLLRVKQGEHSRFVVLKLQD